MSQRNPRTIEQLEALLKEINGVAANVAAAIQKMRDEKLDVVQSSGETVLRAYLPGLARFSTALLQDVSEWSSHACPTFRTSTSFSEPSIAR